MGTEMEVEPRHAAVLVQLADRELTWRRTNGSHSASTLQMSVIRELGKTR